MGARGPPPGAFVGFECWLYGLVEGAGSSYDWCEFAGSFFGVALSVVAVSLKKRVVFTCCERLDVVYNERPWVKVWKAVVDRLAADVTVWLALGYVGSMPSG